MKILWISFYGSWTMPLLEALAGTGQVKLMLLVPAIGGKAGKRHADSGVDIINVPFSSSELFRPMKRSTFSKFERYIEEFRPDVIHVHGTEKNLGDVQRFCPDTPVIISIQGVLGAIRPYCNNYIDTKSIRPFLTVKNMLGRGGADNLLHTCHRGLRYEPSIIASARYFFCRTIWDRAQVSALNPTATIYQGEEILRPEFYAHSGQWSVNQCRRHTMFMPCGGRLKGLHHAIEALRILRQTYDDARLVVPGLSAKMMARGRVADFLFGEDYFRYIRHLIASKGLTDYVELLPRLDGAGMAREMCRANAFLSPSSIDNSPNAVGEATMVGMPVVATPVGGIPSMLTDGENALFAPAGDAATMAWQLRRIFDDDCLATKLGRGAHQLALRRHDIAATVKQYIDGYRDAIEKHKAR